MLSLEKDMACFGWKINLICLGLVLFACAWVGRLLPTDVTNDWKRSLVNVVESSVHQISQPTTIHHRDDQISKHAGRIRSSHEDLPKQPVLERSPKK